jgi:hypothetical protein
MLHSTETPTQIGVDVNRLRPAAMCDHGNLPFCLGGVQPAGSDPRNAESPVCEPDLAADCRRGADDGN